MALAPDVIGISKTPRNFGQLVNSLRLWRCSTTVPVHRDRKSYFQCSNGHFISCHLYTLVTPTLDPCAVQVRGPVEKPGLSRCRFFGRNLFCTVLLEGSNWYHMGNQMAVQNTTPLRDPEWVPCAG